MRTVLVALIALAIAPPSGTAADDGSARALVAGVGSNAMPSWFPDGSRLLFHSRRRDQPGHGLATRNLWTVAADGTDARRLTRGSKDEYHGVVSPDGRRIVFVSELNGSRDLWIADASGQNPVPLTDDPGIEDQPTWSPDSRRICYAAFPKEGGSFDLWVINADGTGRRRLTTTAANEIFPAWHPDGDRIAFVTDANGNFDLYVLSLRDGTTSPLVVSPDHEARPAWSPDGTRLAFSRWPAQGRSTDATLWIANADGTAPVELAAAPAPATHPAFAPDGRTLAFQHRGPTGWEIWRLDLPADLAQGSRIRLAQQVRGGADVDTAKLRNGDTVRGLLRESRLVLRAPYGVLDLRAATVASILFDDRGLARVVLGNGDTASGVLDATELHLAGGGRAPRPALAARRARKRPGRLPRGDAQRGSPLGGAAGCAQAARGREDARGRARADRPGRVRRRRRAGPGGARRGRQPRGRRARRPARRRARRGPAARPRSERAPFARARGDGAVTRLGPALVLTGLLGCAGLHPYRPNFYSVDGDIRLGREFAKEVDAELPLLRHAALQQLVSGIGQRLLESSPEPAYRLFPYTFKVVDTPEVNAFALPGGPI